MSVLIVCVSKEHGNTRKVADAIAAELNAEVVEPSEVDVTALADLDLVGFGSGIRFGRHYRELMKLVARVPKQSSGRAFIFSTSGFGFRWWHRLLRRRLIRRGFVIQDEFCCQALDTMGLLKLLGGVNKGRPDERDLAAAKEFARRLPHGSET